MPLDDSQFITETGSTEIDESHRVVLPFCVALLEAARGSELASTRAAAMALLEQVIAHFEVEGRLMRESNYPDRADHELAHQAFVADFRRMLGHLRNPDQMGLAKMWVESRLAPWWKSHIAAKDAALADHLRRKA